MSRRDRGLRELVGVDFATPGPARRMPGPLALAALVILALACAALAVTQLLLR